MTTFAEVPLLGTDVLNGIRVDHVCDMSVDLEPARMVATPLGTTLVFAARGGRVTGPNINGVVLPGGGDWLHIGADRIGRVDVRATIETDDGVLIGYTAGGLIQIPPDGMQRLAEGIRLPWHQTYIRTTPKFETSHPRYEWLSRFVALGYNELSPNRVDYRIYRVC